MNAFFVITIVATSHFLKLHILKLRRESYNYALDTKRQNIYASRRNKENHIYPSFSQVSCSWGIVLRDGIVKFATYI